MSEELESGDDDIVEDATSSEDDDVIADARKFLSNCKAVGSKNKQEALDDLRFLQGGLAQWDAVDANLRRMDGRPCITINKLPSFVRQVTNPLRQSRSAI